MEWRKGEFISFSAGEEYQVIYDRRGSPVTLPAFALEFAMSCFEFAPLGRHVAKYADKHAWSPMQVEALRECLPALAEAGGIVSAERVRAAASRMPPAAPPPPIALLGFPTGGNRTGLLRRAMGSFVANLQSAGRKVDLAIADSSADAAHQHTFRALAAEVAQTSGLPVLYSGEAERRRFVEALAKAGACAPELAAFALLDPFQTGFACGANRNALLLHGAGEMLCSVDDDVVCELAQPPSLTGERVSLFSDCDPYSRHIFGDREAVRAAAPISPADFVGAHETLLGRSVREFFPGGLSLSELRLRDAGDSILRRLEFGAGVVRTSFLGHAGDPGIPSSCYYLSYDRANLERLTASEESYRTALGSRNVLCSVPALSLGDASVCPGMAMGLDHRSLLPPFFPVLHAEDFSHGAAVWQCCPDAFAGHQPLTVWHDPPAGKPLLQPRDLGPSCRVVIFEFAHLLRKLLLDFEPAPHASASARMQSLGRTLSELAEQPPEDFVESLREKILEHESEKLGFLEDRLQYESSAPDYWRNDVEDFLSHARDALCDTDFDIPYDLKQRGSAGENRLLMQRLIGSYGRLLVAWPGLVDAARMLREQGVFLMPPQ